MGRGADQTLMSNNATVTTRVRDLIQQGYEQVSRKYRTLARLPEGVTGLEALRRFDPKLVAQWEEALEHTCADYYRRIHAGKVTLTIEEFTEYRRQLDAKWQPVQEDQMPEACLHCGDPEVRTP